MSRHPTDITKGVADLELGAANFLNTLDPAIRARVDELRVVQHEKDKIAAQFEADVRQLERKYWQRYQPHFDQRFNIVNGQVISKSAGPKGIPDFWLRVLKSHPDVSVTISSRDEGALKQLTNVRAEYTDTGFQLFFHFAPNVYFSNSVLSKAYYFQTDAKTGLAARDHSIGDDIKWKAGKNLRVRIREKKVKDKRGNQSLQSEATPTDSFFDFFSPPRAMIPGSGDQADQSDEWLRIMDFDIGERFKADLIPRAVYWYTGEAAEHLEMDDASDGGDSGDEMDFSDSDD